MTNQNELITESTDTVYVYSDAPETWTILSTLFK